MSHSAARSLSLLLMLAAFPLISIGTMGDRPLLWWLGLVVLALGAMIPPVLRYAPEERSEPKSREATDLGESCRVC